MQIYLTTERDDHTPLALHMIREYILTACADDPEFDTPVKASFVNEEIFLSPRMASLALPKMEPGLWFLSSYIWSADLARTASEQIKRANPENIVIHGGPESPKYPNRCEAFLRQHPYVDYVVHGEGEVTAAELVKELAGKSANPRPSLRHVDGISFLEACGEDAGEPVFEYVQTSPRARIKDLGILPSPYLSGSLDKELQSGYHAIHESNRGCPYGCAFCDWGSAIQTKIRQFPLERVLAEIDVIGRNKCDTVFQADANFGILPRDVEIAQAFADTRRKYGYPREIVASFAKTGADRIADIVKIWRDAGIVSNGIIALQSVNEDVLSATKRSNIKTSHFYKLASKFSDMELPISADLMFGLPGSSVSSMKGDIQAMMDMDIEAKIYPTSMLTNSPMASPDFIRQHQLEVGKKGTVVASSTFTREDHRQMQKLSFCYTMLEKTDVTRIVSRFMQWDMGVPAADLLYACLDLAEIGRPDQETLLKDPNSGARQIRMRNALKSFSEDWSAFYDMIKDKCLEFAPDAMDHGLHTAMAANQAIMPDPTKQYPRNVALDHDVPAYLRDHKAGRGRPLVSYGPAELHVTLPNERVDEIMKLGGMYDTHTLIWSMNSTMSRTRSGGIATHMIA